MNAPLYLPLDLHEGLVALFQIPARAPGTCRTGIFLPLTGSELVTFEVLLQRFGIDLEGRSTPGYGARSPAAARL